MTTEQPMGSRDDVLNGGGTGGTTSSPVTFPVPSINSVPIYNEKSLQLEIPCFYSLLPRAFS